MSGMGLLIFCFHLILGYQKVLQQYQSRFHHLYLLWIQKQKVSIATLMVSLSQAKKIFNSSEPTTHTANATFDHLCGVHKLFGK